MLPPMLHTAQKLTLFDCQIYIVGNAIISATGTAILFIKKKNLLGGENFFWVGKIPGPPPLCMKPCLVSPYIAYNI